jgi:DNA-directed RNA polymerase specialized sigma24 family protein
MPDDPSKSAGSTNFENALAQALPVVYHRLAGMYGDKQLAEEVSADSLSQAWEQWAADHDYFLHHDLIAWSTRRAAWRALDRLRRRNRIRPLPEECGEAGWAVPVRGLRESAAASAIPDREIACRCLEQLPPAERAVLVGHHFEGKTDQEMGEVLDGDEGTPQARGLRAWRLRRKAYDRLRALLIQEGVDPSDWGPPADGPGPGAAAKVSACPA